MRRDNRSIPIVLQKYKNLSKITDAKYYSYGTINDNREYGFRLYNNILLIIAIYYYQRSKGVCGIICGVTICGSIVFGTTVSGVISGGGGATVCSVVVSCGVIICEGSILLSVGTMVFTVNQLNIAGVRSVLPAISVALTWNVCVVLAGLPIPNVDWKTLLSKMTGLKQVNVGRLSILQLYPVIPESSIPSNINVIEFAAVIPPPLTMFNPVLLSIADVMIVSGGVVSTEG